MSSGGAGWPPADRGGLGQGGRYGDEFGAEHDQGADGAGYFDDSGHEWSEPSGRLPGRGDPRGRGRADQYGQSMGRHSGGQPAASYGDSYGQDSHADPYGQSWHGRDAHDRGGYDQGGYDQAGYGHGSYGEARFGSYGDPGYGRDGYGRDIGPDRYAGGPYGQDGYGHDGYGQDGYGQGGYPGEYYGQPPAGRSLPAPDGFGGDGYRQDGLSTDSYGRDLYAQEGYRSAGARQAFGGYQPPDGYGQDNGYPAPGRPMRPALGAGSDQDVTSGYRQDAGSFDGPDGRDGRDSGWFNQPSGTGSFGRPDTGSFGAPDGYLSDGQPDPFAQPDSFGPGEDGEGWGGGESAEHDADWQDDADGGLLSRRFGGGGEGGGGRLSARRVSRRKRPRRLRGKFAFTAAILAGALVLGAVADFGYERFQSWHTSRYGDYSGAGTGQVRFLVPSGAVLSQLGPALMKAGIIKEVRPFDSAAAAAANASRLQPGVYLLHHHMSSALAVQYLLSSGHRIKDQVTIIEGVRASAIAQALAKQTGIPVAQFTQIIEHPPASLGLPSWAGGKTAEGFLFPDTYTLLPKMTALQILQMMVTEFKQKVGAINLVGASHKVFTSPWHALIVASLIQAEAGNVTDFGKISRVVWNRLIAKMPLEFDSTVFYAMGKYGTAVNARQRNFPSPYNTYLHTGLPPGPIGNPGVGAMNAAVHAAHGPWLYFITDTRHKPYITHFTASLSQLQAWQREFQN